MFDRILVGNLGEIATRVIQTCRELRVASTAIASEVYADALHTKLADDVKIVDVSAFEEDRYLSDVEAIAFAAKQVGAPAVHPGYGWYSENPRCIAHIEDAGLTFVGPPSSVLAVMGEKASARLAARDAGLPTVEAEALEVSSSRSAPAAGFPVIVKPNDGTGGDGIRLVRDQSELDEVLSAQRTGDQYVLERFIADARHIEVDVVADLAGNILCLPERDASVQQSYVKLVSESPSPAISEPCRRELRAAAVRLAKHVNYQNAGTVEFLVEPDGTYTFLEMNCRIARGNPATEMVTGIDLIAAQLRVASGDRWEAPRLDVPLGHSITCLVFAEDLTLGISAPAGQLKRMQLPSGLGVRLDLNLAAGESIYDDPLLCKLTTWGITRPEAIHRMSRALREIEVVGVSSNAPLLLSIIESAEFATGSLNTQSLSVPGSERALDITPGIRQW